MINIKARLTGEIDKNLDKFEGELRAQVLRAAAGAMANFILNQARRYALPHVKTGALYNSLYQVYAEDLSDENKQVYRVSWNRTKAPHGHLIEFGTSRAAAYPFIRPAFDHVKEAIEVGKARMRDKMREELRIT
jgi:HK97 gp10 family phage protein